MSVSSDEDARVITTTSGMEVKKRARAPRGSHEKRRKKSSKFSAGSRNLKVTKRFEDMELIGTRLLKGMFSYGYEKPSAIQKRAIVPILEGRDVVMQAQSGTGKTATIAITSLAAADARKKHPQVLVLSPTREIAQQVERTMVGIASHTSIQVQCCIGGTSVGEDMRRLDAGIQVVSGTPGRVLDLINRKSLVTRKIALLILDEADELLSGGFKQKIEEIHSLLPSRLQVVIVSATMPSLVLDITRRFTRDPLRILVEREQLTLKGISQFYVDCEEEQWKFDTLTDLYDRVAISAAVIFANTRKKVEWLTQKMRENHFAVVCVHGDMHQREREHITTQFRQGEYRVLITTDLWARGIDVDQISLVVNYDMPQTREVYLHRIGRSGRFGRKGLAINFVTSADRREVRELEKFYDTHIDALPADIANLI